MFTDEKKRFIMLLPVKSMENVLIIFKKSTITSI